MPRYEYVCACGERTIGAFAMRDVPAAVICVGCGGEGRRVFSVPQVKPAALYSDANKRGLAELDASRRLDERVYARSWGRRLQRL